MRGSRPYEAVLLSPVENAIGASLRALDAKGHDTRLEMLEAVACDLANLDLGTYRSLFGVTAMLKEDDLRDALPPITAALRSTPVPPALALAALASEPLSHPDRRKSGSYYTDFRLAQYLAARAGELTPISPDTPVIDPASGTGILLVAVALVSFGADHGALDEFIGGAVCAADLSASALRGTRLALASLARHVSSIQGLDGRLRLGDSLVNGPGAWDDIAPFGFDLVIGNPPWEKLRISRHEHLRALGTGRHYGAEYQTDDALGSLEAERSKVARYVRSLDYELSGKGDPDLYKLFVALSVALAKDGGQIAMLVPASLIRSEGARRLREHLVAAAPDLRIAVLHNRARFFSIDTRFKFLALNALLGSNGEPKPLTLAHADAAATEITESGRAHLDRHELELLRPDLSVPEVRSEREWHLFRRLSQEGTSLGETNGPWHLRFAREADMTGDRHRFKRVQGNGDVALIEGRMVHQFRHTAKVYVSGTGRRAEWAWQQPGEATLQPQFFVNPNDLRESVQERIASWRVGFCDITGQTNERSMLAALIPPGVVCGNKVPTITFTGNWKEDFRSQVFLGVVNSFVFDWLLRRVLTTTVNYFVLLSVPFPNLDLEGSTASRIAELTRAIEKGYVGDTGDPPVWSLRAELDARVMRAYGIDPHEADLIFEDFALLDGGQQPLLGERRSTVTRDVVLHEFGLLSGVSNLDALKRADAALSLGAEPFVPSQSAKQRGHSTASRSGLLTAA
jgi:hypothetical protein